VWCSVPVMKSGVVMSTTQIAKGTTQFTNGITLGCIGTYLQLYGLLRCATPFYI
jgi:hypothetical protein